MIALIWKSLLVLLSVSGSDVIQVTESQWLENAKKFGRMFINVYSENDVTPYLHILIFHIGFFREHYGGLEKYGNFAIEGRHQWNKSAIPTGTSHYSGYGEPLAMQLLKRSARETKAKIEKIIKIPTSKYTRNDGWSSKRIRLADAEMAKALESFGKDFKCNLTRKAKPTLHLD